MSKAFALNSSELLNKWYNSKFGQAVLLAEQSELNKILTRFFGYYLLQLGEPCKKYFLAASPIRHHIYYTDSASKKTSSLSVCGPYNELPFQPESIDVILMPHLLEQSKAPQLILKEAIQAIIPEGQIIILGFNPFSLLGIQRILQYRNNIIPWAAYFYRAGLIRQWLLQLDCEIITSKVYSFNSSLEKEEKPKKSNILQQAVKISCSKFGSLYIIAAQKKVIGIQPIKYTAVRPQFVTGANVRGLERDKIC